jgi:glycosyltransferase involved in cell wall biosynthesis
VKLIALLAVKNEEWILPAYLSSVAPLVDDIVAMDDGSSDGSRRLLEQAGAHVIDNTVTVESGYAEKAIRVGLLHAGRARGGTHFLSLDADEALTAPARSGLRSAISDLGPGQKLALRWLTLWKDPQRFRDGDGSAWSGLKKDFAFADAGAEYDDDDAFLHVARTPGANDADLWQELAVGEGAVLHYQFVPWWRTQVKQAWYRCSELIRTPDRAFEINGMYSITLDDRNDRTRAVPPEWLEGIDVPDGIADLPPAWHLDQIQSWFDRYGVEFFEPLQIWHIPVLRELFVQRTGRRPRSLLFRLRQTLRARL